VGATWGRTLWPDDIAGVCYLYPSAAFACGGDSDCPAFFDYYGGGTSRTNCNSVACLAGAGTYGVDCFAAADCASGVCMLDPDDSNPNDPGFCAQSCSTSAQDCPLGDLCADVGSGPYCWRGRANCVAAVRRTECQAIYGVNGYCVQDLDGTLRCRKTCLNDSQCSGEVCYGGTGAPPPGFCRSVGSTALGQPCDNGLQCVELTCAGAGTQPTCSTWPWPRGGDSGPDGADSGGDSARTDPLFLDDGGPLPPGGQVTGGCACGSLTGLSWLLAAAAIAALRRRL